MLRRTQSSSIRYVCLSWTADGNSVGKALPLLGFKTYNMKAMLSQSQHGQIHPQLWDNYLRPKGEHFEGNSENDTDNSNNDSHAFTANKPLITKSRIVAQNKMAQRLGVATQEKLKIDNIADYDAIVGLPVSAIEPEQLVEFFPGYTKFILVEETNKPEWTRQHVEEGVVPILVNLQAMMQTSPTGKVWYSLFRHFAWPESASKILGTLPENNEREMIQPSFMQKMTQPGKSRKNEENIASRVGNIEAVQNRKKWAEEALTDYEKRVKASIPSDRLYVYRDGDGWEPLVHFTGKEFEMIETLPKFPEQDFGKEFLDMVRFRVARTVMVSKMVNVTAIGMILVLAYMLNEYFRRGFEKIMDDAKKVVGSE